MSAADYLAHEIEWINAKERARVINNYRRGREAKTSAAIEFDPLAAKRMRLASKDRP